MRKITIWILATVTVVTLMFAYRTSRGDQENLASGADPKSNKDTSSTNEDAAGNGSSTAASGNGSTSGGSSSGTGTSSGGASTVNGKEVSTRWGTVQVQIVVSNGKITNVKAVKTPNENQHDIEINKYAVPILNKEALAAQSADIDAVSGATVTSNGYRTSLQSAIDSARLGK